MAIARIKTGLSLHSNYDDLLNGLPFEVWRLVFSFLGAKDLCRCSQVCKDWSALVASLDSTRWRELYLRQEKTKRWKHPNWPNETNRELKQTWKELYRKRYRMSKLWLQNEVDVSCIVPFLFSGKKVQRVFHVGINRQYHTIKSALDKATAYSRIIVHPGVYQDSSTLYLKYPVAIIGIDDPSKVVLMMQVEMRCDSAKLENLTIKPLYVRGRDRGTAAAVVRVLTGHLCMYNCIINQGCVNVVSPGSTTILNCTFSASFINLQGIGYSSITNSDFTPNRIAILIEEPLFQFPVRPSVTPEGVGGWLAISNETAFEEYYKSCVKGGSSKRKILPDFSKPTSYIATTSAILTDNESSDVEDENNTSKKTKENNRLNSATNKESEITSPFLDSNVKRLLKASQGVIINNVRIANGRGGITICRMGQAWIENSMFHNLVYGVRCLQNSKCIMLNNKIHSCETTGVFFRDHSAGLVAGNQIFANGEAGIDIRSNANPIIQHNEIHSGRRSGIVCLENGKGLMRQNDIYNNAEAGIYILQNGNPKIKNNFIWSGKASGICVTEHGRGHITKNVITGMEWAGIDVRHGGNPVISHNIIKNGHSDGIVVGEKGKSVILDNTIEGNSGCGIWILDGSYPLVHSNRIIYSGNNGIAFVSNIDHEHNRRFQPQPLQNVGMRQNNQDILVEEGVFLEDDDFPLVPIPIPEVEPESRYIHVSKPEKTLAQIESNHVENNRGSGILYDGQEGIVISKNHIAGNSKHGISLLRSSEIFVQNNVIRNNLLSGINIAIGVCVSISDNGIYDNKENGIVTAGLGMIKLNDILSHGLPSLLVKSMANMTVSHNRLHSWKDHCLYVEEKCRLLFEQNEIFITSSATEIKDGVEDLDLHSESYLHSDADIDYSRDEVVISMIGPVPYRDGLTVKDLCLASDSLDLESLKPNLAVNNTVTAPFFTSVQLGRNKQRNRSSFCALL